MVETEQQEIEALSAIALEVANLMPFPVEVAADMGGNWVTHIELGRRGELDDDPPDRASIDVGAGETWGFDVDGGVTTIMSGFDRNASPADVAQWIAEEAIRQGSPAAVAAAEPTTAQRIADLKQQHVSMATWTAEHGGGPVQAAPAHSGPSL